MDIAIAGAGVAGLSAADFLCRLGHRVVIFDQLASPAPVGSGLILQHTGRTILRALGLEAQAQALGARIDRLHGKSVPAGRTVLDVRFSAIGEQKFGVALHRAALFNLLFESAMKAGAEFEPSFQISTLHHYTDEKVSLVSGSAKKSAKFDLVIDALGARSALAGKPPDPLAYGALWANIEWPGAASFDVNALEQRYRRAAKMAGVLPIGRVGETTPRLASFFWSLKHCDLENWRRGGLQRWKDDVVNLWPETASFIDQIESADQLAFASYAHRTLKNPIGRRIAHIGDAYHSASPQLGQGANMALLDAYAIAAALEKSQTVCAALEKFSALRRRHISLYQAMSFLFTPVYESDSQFLPWLRDIVAAPLSRIPPAPRLLAAMVSGAIGSPLGKLGFSQ